MINRIGKILNLKTPFTARDLIKITYPWMIFWAICVHFMWGVVLVIEPTVVRLVALVGLNRIADAGVSGEILGIVLILASIAAFFGLVLERRVKKILCLILLMPQYFLMLTAFFSDLEIIIGGYKSDMTGQEIDRSILLVLLGPLVFAAFFHTLAILERFVVPWPSLEKVVTRKVEAKT